jgi:1-phosphatidylinositol phosphodiesterase
MGTIITVYLVNNGQGAIVAPGVPPVVVANDGKPVRIAQAVAEGTWGSFFALRTINAHDSDMEIFLTGTSGKLRDYGVRLRGDTSARGTDTMAGTRVSLDGDSLTVTIDHVFAPWTGKLAGTLQLHQVTMPGTHDSGTFGMGAYNCCQDMTILEQLYVGVRYFDIRVSTNSAALRVVHASYDTYCTLAEVAATFRKFLDGTLNVNASEETIVVQLKIDDGPDDLTWAQAIVACVNQAFVGAAKQPYLDPIEQNGPTMADLKGRLVVLRRLDGLPHSVGGTPVKYFVSLAVFEQYWGTPSWVSEFGANQFEWVDPGTGNVDYRTLQGVSFRLQDNYQTTREIKANIVRGVLDDAANGVMPDSWYLNFSSAAPAAPPRWVADYVNPRVEGWLDQAAKNPNLARYGTVLMDFPSIAMCEKLIAKNF